MGFRQYVFIRNRITVLNFLVRIGNQYLGLQLQNTFQRFHPSTSRQLWVRQHQTLLLRRGLGLLSTFLSHFWKHLTDSVKRNFKFDGLMIYFSFTYPHTCRRAWYCTVINTYSVHLPLPHSPHSLCSLVSPLKTQKQNAEMKIEWENEMEKNVKYIL